MHPYETTGKITLFICTFHDKQEDIKFWANNGRHSQILLRSKFNMHALQATHHTDNTPPIFWIRTHHISAAYITPQTLNNFKFHCFIISHFYPTLLYIIIQNKIFTQNYIFLIS
jgi:hypothetical protein